MRFDRSPKFENKKLKSFEVAERCLGKDGMRELREFIDIAVKDYQKNGQGIEVIDSPEFLKYISATFPTIGLDTKFGQIFSYIRGLAKKRFSKFETTEKGLEKNQPFNKSDLKRIAKEARVKGIDGAEEIERAEGEFSDGLEQDE